MLFTTLPEFFKPIVFAINLCIHLHRLKWLLMDSSQMLPYIHPLHEETIFEEMVYQYAIVPSLHPQIH